MKITTRKIVILKVRRTIARQTHTTNTLANLIAKCDPDAAMPKELIIWDSATASGNEFK